MKDGALLINTSRGAVVNTRAVIDALKRQRLGGLAIDVYEEEDALFFEDRSDQTIMDDQFARLLTFPNVLITGHQGFFTVEALTNIAATTIANLDTFEQTGSPLHPVAIQSPTSKSPASADARRPVADTTIPPAQRRRGGVLQKGCGRRASSSDSPRWISTVRGLIPRS